MPVVMCHVAKPVILEFVCALQSSVCVSVLGWEFVSELKQLHVFMNGGNGAVIS